MGMLSKSSEVRPVYISYIGGKESFLQICFAGVYNDYDDYDDDSMSH